MKKDNFLKRNELVSLKGNTLSIFARKTLDYIYKNAIEVYKKNKNKGIFELNIIELKKEIGMNRTTDHSGIIKELNEIENLKFETYDSKYYSKIPILAGFQILEDKILRVALSPFLIELIFDEENPYYHVANFMEYKYLKSKYSKIILDLYNRYKPTDIPKMSKEEFEERLQYSKNYRNNDIKKYVLEQAQKELENHNNLELKWEFFPNPRKWTEIKLSIKNQKKVQKKVSAIKIKTGLGSSDFIKHELEQKNLRELEASKAIIGKEINRIKITEEDYEALYLQYLKKIGEKHNIFIKKSFDINNRKKI